MPPKGQPLAPEHRAKIKASMQRYRKPVVHGTTNAYNNKHCRCDPCRRAWSEYLKERARRRESARAGL